jgi:hypothetical protein
MLGAYRAFAVEYDPAAAATAMEDVHRCDPEMTSFDEYVRLLLPVFMGFKMNGMHAYQGVNLYRTRVLKAGEQKFSHLKDITAPPPHLTKPGRCNPVGRPVFYASTSKETAILESRAKEGETLVISQWKTTTRFLLNNLGYTVSCFKNLGAVRSVQVDQPNPHAYDLLTDSFTRKDEMFYPLSAAIFEKMTMKGEPPRLPSPEGWDVVSIRGLQYPSIQMNANGDNVALKLDDNLVPAGAPYFVGAEFVEVGEYCPKTLKYITYEMDRSDRASKDGGIIWDAKQTRVYLQYTPM